MAVDLFEKSKARLAREVGGMALDGAAAVKFALAFPNVYKVGMASLGYQLVYRMLNSLPNASCERVFLPDDDDLKEHLRTQTEVFTLETMRPLSEFDVVAFSISFEMDYLNVLRILKLANLPVESRNRGDFDPLVIAGGPCATFNPEPLADIVDAFVIGDAEEVLPSLVDAIESTRGKPRADALAALSSVSGVYVPSFYKVEYADTGEIARVSNIQPAPEKIRRAVTRDLTSHPPDSMIRAEEAEFGDITLIEVARGCGRKCRFCLAGHITRPPREHVSLGGFAPKPPPETLSLDSARSRVAPGPPTQDLSTPCGVDKSCVGRSRKHLFPCGVKGQRPLWESEGETLGKKGTRFGLVGAAVFDFSEAVNMCREIVESGGAFNVSSVRLETVTPEVAQLLAAGGQKTLTIAPEAGSERLRRVINKNATDEDVFSAVSAAREAGINRIKLYFMIGLPTETAEDIDAIIDLVRRLASSFPGMAFQVSVSCFVPKPWTPFQWCAMEHENVLKKRYAALRSGISSIKGAQFGGESPRLAAIQALLARGDRRLGRMLIAALENDGDYSAALRRVDIDPAFYLYRERRADETLPWDHLDMLIGKDYLRREYENALNGVTTPPCDIGPCRACGACGV
ncbi:MAG: radical SAM protein [Armatimonadetes bacterium]|nr:radical SAM protein [Armatimonadota bacterium]